MESTIFLEKTNNLSFHTLLKKLKNTKATQSFILLVSWLYISRMKRNFMIKNLTRFFMLTK